MSENIILLICYRIKPCKYQQLWIIYTIYNNIKCITTLFLNDSVLFWFHKHLHVWFYWWKDIMTVFCILWVIVWYWYKAYNYGKFINTMYQTTKLSTEFHFCYWQKYLYPRHIWWLCFYFHLNKNVLLGS